jgi:hypothetical protein
MFVNEWDIERLVTSTNDGDHPNLHQAALTLERFKDWVNSNSDGWPYWIKARKSSERLQERLHAFDTARFSWGSSDAADITEAELKRLYTPIKSFLTRHGSGKDIVFPEPGNQDLPVGYRWMTAEEVEWYMTRPLGIDIPGVVGVHLTVDSTGKPYEHAEVDLAIKVGG